jgi:MFS family permease
MHAPTPLPIWATTLSRDGWLLFAACGVRNFAYGFLSVVLGVYLSALGLSVEAIGGIFTASLAGGAVMTLLLTSVADRLGRRQILVLGAALMAAAGVVFALTDQLIVLTLAAVPGTISLSGKEVGPFLSVEQAILPQTASDARRTDVFAAHNLVNYLATALGALVVGVPALLGLSALQGYQLLIWGYAAIGLVLLVLFAGLSPAAEAGGGVAQRASRSGLGVRESRGTVFRLATLFAVDSFAGGSSCRACSRSGSTCATGSTSGSWARCSLVPTSSRPSPSWRLRGSRAGSGC